MNLPKFGRRQWLQLAASVVGALLMLALLVLIPLKTHRAPVPDTRFDEPRPTPTALPLSSPDVSSVEIFHPSAPDRDEDLQQIVTQFVEQQPGDWDIYVYNLSHGNYAVSSPEDEKPMVSASLIKLFIMASTFQQIKEKKLEYWDVFHSIRYMIINSDNYCANWLIQRMGEGDVSKGFDYINAFVQSLGCKSTSIHRVMLDTESGEENYTSAEDCVTLLKMLYRYELVSPEYSSDMVEMLKQQRTNDRIPALLPEGTVCAHKTGDLEHLSCGDAGLVFSPGADYILAVINNNSEDDPATIQSIAELSAQIYAYYNPPLPETPSPEAEGEAST